MNKPARQEKRAQKQLGRVKRKTERIATRASKRAAGKSEARAQKITGRAAERYERVVNRYNKKSVKRQARRTR